MKLVLATHNRHKVVELQRILAGLDVELLGASEVALPDVDETGSTFAENALLKAKAAAAESGMVSVADDSGLEVDALGGEPGVRSARYSGGNDLDNLRLVMQRLGDSASRTARFVCVAALATPCGKTYTTEGVLDGAIARAPRGTRGFGYDPIFQPDGYTQTTAEMAPEKKDRISHRGLAFRELRPVVIDIIGR